MKYHAKLYYGNNEISYWNNWNEENLIEKLIVPFINGQVILHKKGGKKILLNLKNVFELRIYKTVADNIDDVKITASTMKNSYFEQYDCTEEVIENMKVALASKSSQSLLQKSFAAIENQVFIIMKFGDKILDSAYDGVIKPLFVEFGFSVIRVDEIPDSGKISDQILEQIAKSKFVFSDLSGERPNCYYETGFAHALGKEIILSIHTKDVIHFDLSGHRFIQCETESQLRKELRKRIEALLERN